MTQMLTVLDVVQRSSAFLEGKGVESPRLNAEWLIASALGIDRMKLYMQFDRPLSESELADNYDGFRSDFCEFFPLLVAHVGIQGRVAIDDMVAGR